jgi:hypothetical protein
MNPFLRSDADSAAFASFGQILAYKSTMLSPVFATSSF